MYSYPAYVIPTFIMQVLPQVTVSLEGRYFPLQVLGQNILILWLLSLIQFYLFYSEFISLACSNLTEGSLRDFTWLWKICLNVLIACLVFALFNLLNCFFYAFDFFY